MKKAPYIFTLAIAAFLTSCSTEKQAVASQKEKFAKDFTHGLETGIAANTKEHYNECFAEDFAHGFNEGIKTRERFTEDFTRGFTKGLKAAEEKKKSE